MPGTHKIYLAGLISTEKPGSIHWRGVARVLLSRLAAWNDKEIEILDPMRGKHDLAESSPDKGLTDPRFTSSDIILRDYHDVDMANIILVNLNDFGSERPLVGTLMELAWAWEHRKLAIAVCDDSNLLMRNHPFVRSAVSHWFNNLEEACKFIVDRVI